MRDVRDAGNRRKILYRVIGAVLQQALIGRMGLVGAEHERVAVGLGARDRGAADHPGAAGAVVDNDRVPEIAAAPWAISRATTSTGPPAG